MSFVQEKKWIAPFTQKDFALAWLRQACLPDPQYPKGCVKSIYYDTPSLSHYREKSNGDYLKSKARLRWYGSEGREEYVTAFAEIKSKTGSGREKTRKKIAVKSSWIESVPLHDPSLMELFRRDELKGFFPARLIPVITIVYERFRFICPYTKARVCLDSGIHTERFNSNLFSFISADYKIFFSFIVLEIKDNTGEDEIPWIHTLYEKGFRSRSVSKFGTGISKLIKGEII